MDENAVGEAVLGCAIKVHRTLGPGLLEGAYETCLAHEIGKAGLSYQQQIVLPVFYDNQRIDIGYRFDLLVEGRVVVEVKTVDKLIDFHRAQLLSYLKLDDYRLGYLQNFNVAILKEGIVRMVNNL